MRGAQRLSDAPPVIAEAFPPAEPPRSWGPARAFGVLGIYLAAQLWVGVIGGAVAMVALGLPDAMRGQRLDPALQARVLMPVALVAGILSAGGGFAFSLIHGRPRLFVGTPGGFGLVRSSSRSVLSGMLGGVLLAAVFTFLAPLVVPSPPKSALGPVAQAATASASSHTLWLAFALLVAPLGEEYLFRGVLASGLRERLGAIATAAIVTAVFTAMHVTEALAYWPAFVSIALLGVLGSYARERSGSLVPSVAAHFSYNLVVASQVSIAFW